MAPEKVTPSPKAGHAEAERPEAERVAKVMARAGICSRRDAEKMVLAGRVSVNGKVIDSPALDVSPQDKVTLDGKPIDAPQETRVWLYYKPLGLVTSEKDEKGRQTVFDTLPEGMPRVMSVGRLDLNSEGLLLLTNDGGLKRRLELPETGWLRKYRVRVNGRPDNATFDPLRRGIVIDGEEFQPMEVTLDRQQGANAWLTVGIREGRNREIRRTMEVVKMVVNRLIRVSYGPFRLNEMEPGAVVEVKRKVLRDQLGERLLTGNDDAPERAPRRDEGDRGAGPRRPREDGGRGGDRKSFGAAPREGGDRKPYGDRPRRDEGERGGYAARKPYGDKAGDRPAREGGEHKPFGPRGDAPADGSRKPRWSAEKPSAKGPGGGARPARSQSNKPYGERAEGRSLGDKPGSKPYGERSEGRSNSERPGVKASGYKSHAARSDDRPAGKSYGERAEGRSFGDKPAGKPYSDKPRSFGDKPAGKSYGDKPRSFGDKPAGKSYGGKPGGKSAGFKSHGGGAGGGRAAGSKSHGGSGRPGAARPAGGPRGAGGGKPGPRGRG
ncbi:pseudouridine synthase [Phaeovulum sp.]|uniref:pseudouridine synthase n=1 Tax=Phaeovulum sp. TaxID=2934796 RepID=UPI0039E719AE